MPNNLRLRCNIIVQTCKSDMHMIISFTDLLLIVIELEIIGNNYRFIFLRDEFLSWYFYIYFFAIINKFLFLLLAQKHMKQNRYNLCSKFFSHTNQVPRKYVQKLVIIGLY